MAAGGAPRYAGAVHNHVFCAMQHVSMGLNLHTWIMYMVGWRREVSEVHIKSVKSGEVDPVYEEAAWLVRRDVCSCVCQRVQRIPRSRIATLQTWVLRHGRRCNRFCEHKPSRG
jgi:hypothetical protein